MAKKRGQKEIGVRFVYDGTCTKCSVFFGTDRRDSVFQDCPICGSWIIWNDNKNISTLKFKR